MDCMATSHLIFLVNVYATYVIERKRKMWHDLLMFEKGFGGICGVFEEILMLSWMIIKGNEGRQKNIRESMWKFLHLFRRWAWWTFWYWGRNSLGSA